LALASGEADPALRSAAQLGMGKALWNAGDLAGARREFAAFLEAYPESAQAAEAHFLLAEAARNSSDWDAALAHYRVYLELRPGALASYVQERIGLAALGKGDYAEAASAYEAAVNAPRVGDVLLLRERLAEIYVAQGRLDEALAQYEAIFQGASVEARKAHALALMGRALYDAGRVEAAHERFLQAVNDYPAASAAFPGLVTLVQDGVPVDETQRGLTNYYAANYDPALAAFDRALAADPTNTTALFFKARSLEALQRKADAIETLRTLVSNAPGDALWARAYLQIAFIQDYPADVQTFQDFVAAAPNAPEAPDALFRAARLCERNDDFACAARLWTRIAQEYPSAAQAADAAMQAGIVLYRSGDYGTAAQRFELAATLTAQPDQQARAWLWIGKVKQKQGDAGAAQAAWQKARALAPDDYYALRAGQLLRGEAPFAPPARYSFVFDVTQERAEAEAWLRATFPQAEAFSNLSELGPGLWKEARFVRGAELWRLGLLREAHAEFDSLRQELQGDPMAMWQLALYFNDLGAYDLAIRSARRVLDLAGLADPFSGPMYLQRLRYPAPFGELVVAASAEYGLHPFYMYAKMRLESFFWKYALSSAEARGLNQIIPSTADDIARRLNLQNFQQADLFRPVLSIPMGAFYLDYVGATVADDPAAILTGYYAGPGNAAAWRALANNDPDLFVEVIRLPDAKGYVETAFEYFEVYRRLYGQ
jgi:soluble lytic murein transglycosylase